jgi:mono/diheme cytochrome c family protein
MRGPVGTAGLALAGLIFQSTSALADSELVRRGQAIVQAECGSCHAIGRGGVSPMPKAQPLRAIVRRYRLPRLAEVLAGGIVSGHADTEFDFEADEIGAMLAYLGSISR